MTARVTTAITALATAVVAITITVVAALASADATPASASPASDDQPGHATFQGATVNLAAGWHGAQSCVVFTLGDTRCYATHREADDVLGYRRATDPLYRQAIGASGGVGLAATPACAYSWLCLYEHPNGGGRRLIFRDEYLQYLSNWGFAGMTSSWRNNQGLFDGGRLSMYNLSGSYTLSPNSYVANLGNYDEQAYAVVA